MSIKQKIGAALATGSLLAATLLPGAAFASNTVTISGNGTGSINTAAAVSVDVSLVNQSNVAVVENTVIQGANSGNNTADGNTNSNTTISTGGASASSTTNTSGNSNSAVVASSSTPSTTVTISGNGPGSTNTGFAAAIKFKRCRQSNVGIVVNLILQGANSGGNSASGNTGSNTAVSAGGASVGSSNTTSGNSNGCTL